MATLLHGIELSVASLPVSWEQNGGSR
jgi:hypothetical protein